MHLFQSYARSKSSHKIAFDFLKFSEASEQQRIKHSQRSKLFITIQFIPYKKVALCSLENPRILWSCQPLIIKQGFPGYYRILIMWPWPRPFIWSSWTIVLTAKYADIMLSRLGLYPVEAFHRWFFFRASSSVNLEWIFTKLDSGFHEQKIPGFQNPDSLTWGDLNARERFNTWKIIAVITGLIAQWKEHCTGIAEVQILFKPEYPVVLRPVSSNPGLILTRVSFSFYQKHSLG